MRRKQGDRIVLHESFIKDMRELLDYLSERSLSCARQTRSRIFKSISLLTEFYQLGKSVDEALLPGRRYLIIEEYIVLYVISEEEIYIQRLVSEKQDYFRYL